MWVALALATLAASPGPTGADDAEVVSALQIRGAKRTKPATFEALLPRALPARMSDEDVEELERRITNLGIFDEVALSRAAGSSVLLVDVREKWTLTPNAGFSTGATWQDASGFVGITEHNAFGSGSAVSAWVSRAQRGFGAGVAFEPHGYARGLWSVGGEAAVETASFRFEDDDTNAWRSRWFSVETYVLPPLAYDETLRFGLAASYTHEAVSDVTGPDAPRGGHVPSVGLFVVVDRHTWDDLTPHGWRLEIGAEAAYLLPARSARHGASATLDLGVRLAHNIVLSSRTRGEVVPAGDPNHSALLGTQEGVRGLPDALFRNRAHVFENLELRAGLRVRARWALQGVLFADGAVFQPLDAEGHTEPARTALGFGAGVRVIPTFLTSLLLRVDAARVARPEPTYLVLTGLGQYF